MENNIENMELYNKFGTTPENAKKPILAGRLKGMTDTNPMFRIKSLTEQFGPVGFGWYYEITEKWLETGSEGVICAFVDINLYVKYKGQWSKPIQGTGGSTFVAKEQKGLYTDDEAYKKALTDAISVACKSLGMCADIYYAKDAKYGTKYEYNPNNSDNNSNVEIEIDLNSKVGGNGKYKDMTWLEANKENPTYLQWCIDNSKSQISKAKFESIKKAIEDNQKEAQKILMSNLKEEPSYIEISDEEAKTLFN